MVGTFLYLTACSLKNRVRRRLRRLREPRYLIGLIVGAAYFYFMIIGRVGRSRSGMSPLTALGPFAEPLAFAGSVFLLAAAAVAWVWPGSGSPLSFSRAEVQFLFPAPVTRRQLIHYKILRSQLGILFGSAVVTLIMRPGWIGGGWTFLAGLWMLLLNARLHFMAVTLTRRSLAEHGRSALLHQWGPLAVVATVITALAATVAQHWSALVTLPDTEMVFAEIQRIGTSGAAGAILWPFRALVRLPLAASPAAFAAALPPVAALLALHYVWVLRADAAFEEASAEQAERRALDRTAKPSVSRATAATPFRLALDGPPETAILWKNLILVGRYLSLRTFIRLLPLVVGLGIVARVGGGRGLSAFLASACLPLAAFAILLGPQMVRNDLRQDLANLAMLKTWPIRGAALVRGELLAPVAVVTGAAWLLILTAAALFGAQPLTSRAGAEILLNRASYTIAALLVAPALILSQTVVQNALAVLFPAWVVAAGSRSRGIDAMGQRLLMLGANMLALALSIVPGALVAGAVMLGVYALTGVIPVVVPALLLSAVVVAECWLATELLGRVLDRMDVTALDPAE